MKIIGVRTAKTHMHLMISKYLSSSLKTFLPIEFPQGKIWHIIFILTAAIPKVSEFFFIVITISVYQ